MPTPRSPLWLGMFGFAWAAWVTAGQPSQDRIIGIDELRPGMKGEVWTVFRGTEPEPFAVEVVGVSRQGLGPGRAMIICQLTDPRVQRSGAAAGMSGSPLYVDGRWAGALSYQVQRFETVRHAGFTPAADMLAVAKAPQEGETPRLPSPEPSRDGPQPLGLAFTLTGIAPDVAAVFQSAFADLGIDLSRAPLAGATDAATTPPQVIQAASPIGVVLAHGDVNLGGTGTVTRVQGREVFAFGHPMMSLGATEVPFAEAEVVTILPSLQSSFKLANIGRLIGTMKQDRLSAIYGELGPIPELIPVSVTTPERSLRFQVIPNGRLIPLLVATGTLQVVTASNAQGGAEGYRIRSRFDYGDGAPLEWENWYEGPNGVQNGALELAGRLALPWQSPFRGLMPKSVAIEVERLGESPLATLDALQTSGNPVYLGEELSVHLQLRARDNRLLETTVATTPTQEWAGRRLELAVVNGPQLERLLGQPEGVSINQLRDLPGLKTWLRQTYRDDGAYVVVYERTLGLLDQTLVSPEAPGSIERIARRADEARFTRREVLAPLWIQHVFPGQLFEANLRRPLQILD